MTQQIVMLIADDQQPARQGLKALLTQCPKVEIIVERGPIVETIIRVAGRKEDELARMWSLYPR
jgi:DNA-binding NarL/FixJ family response regulator